MLNAVLTACAKQRDQTRADVVLQEMREAMGGISDCILILSHISYNHRWPWREGFWFTFSCEARASVDTVSFNIVFWQQAVDAGVVLQSG